MSSPLNLNSFSPPETHNSIKCQPDSENTHIHTTHKLILHHTCTNSLWITADKDYCLSSVLDPAAFVQYYCWPHEWFSSEQCVCVCVCVYTEVDEFTCSVFKVRVQHLLSGAALEMFLSCCLSFLLSWRISSRSLASPSSPPAAWDERRWMEEKGRNKKGHLLEEIKPTREEEWKTDDVKWCKGEKKHGDGEGKRWVVGDVRDKRNKIYGVGRGEMWSRRLTVSKTAQQKHIRQIFGSVFSCWFDVMYLNGHSEPMYNNKTCNIDFSTRNICKLSVGKQTHHFTAYWSCQRWQGEKCCHHLCHSRSRLGTGKELMTDSAAHTNSNTQKPIK